MQNKTEDLTNKKFGRWTVLHRIENPKGGRDAYWLCQCECSTIRAVMGKNLKNGRSTSCGCWKKELNRQQMIQYNKEHAAINITGEKYGLLTALQPTDKRKHGSVVWKCKCDCGNICYYSVDELRQQHNIKSCGCLSSSYGEKIIEDILKENNIQYIKEYKQENWKFPDTNGYARFDFYLPTYNRLIEFDGRQHFEETKGWRNITLAEQQKHDTIKNNFAKEQDIDLIRIPYWEESNITLDNLLNEKYLVK